jgi:hypothetical protein
VKVRLHAPDGAARTAQAELAAFTGRVLWADELFEDLESLLGDSGFGTILVTSAEADVNCQILTCSTTGGVSLQHMWGY